MSRIRVINAIIKKYIINLVRYPTWIIQLAIWPIILPLIYILGGIGMAGPDRSGFDTFSKLAGTHDFIGYIIVGNMIWLWVNTCLWSFGASLRNEQMEGTLESNWLCPINRFDLMIGGAIANLIDSAIIITVSMIEYRFIYGVHFTGNILTHILAFIIFIPAVYGLSLTIASLVLSAKEVGATVQLARGIVSVFCGVSYPVILLPGFFKIISDVLPFTYGINAARAIMLNGVDITDEIFYKPAIICVLIGCLFLLIGRICFAIIEGKVRESGSLERF